MSLGRVALRLAGTSLQAGPGLSRFTGRLGTLSATLASRTPRASLSTLRALPLARVTARLTLCKWLGQSSCKIGLIGLGVIGAKAGPSCKVMCEAMRPPPASPVARIVAVKKDIPVSVPSKPNPTLPLGALLKLLLPDALWLLVAVGTAFGTALMNIRIPGALGNLVNLINNMSKDGGFDQQVLRTAGMALLGLYSMHGLLTAIYITVLAYVGESLAERMRIQLYKALVTQDMGFFDTHHSGELVGRLTNDVQEFKSAFKSAVSNGLRSTIQFSGSVMTLMMISPELTLLTVSMVPAMVAAGSLFGHFLRVLSRAAQKQVGVATSVADESIGNIRTVRAFATEDYEITAYNKEVQRAGAINMLLGLGIGQGSLTAGDLMAFLVSTQMVQKSLANLSTLFGELVRGSVAGARVLEYILLPATIPVKGGLTLLDIRGPKIEFREVDFTYPSRPEQPVLTKFSLKAEPGQVLALCGPSGSGKSTIGNLVERFYDPQNGQVLLDGMDIKELDPSWVRGKLIGYIGQEPTLFGGTIMENIRYGRMDATDEEVYEAARQANADDFVTGFPESYQTIVGERGKTLSGGQRQRLAIARALLKNPRILILDEATSALDTESERLVQEALDRLLVGRTVIVIAHRLSTIR
eukprot:Ihof_evm21s6 gene=Ihof_evmTU21s6